jgi:hypothetical protein
MNSISPVHTPARTSIPRARTADTIAWGAAHRPRWAIECGEEAVPSGADLHSAIAAEHRPHSLVVALPECLPRAVAHQAGTLGGSNDVGEEDAGKHAVELGLFGLLSTKEPLDLHDDAVRVAQPGHVVSTWHANRAPGMRSAMLIDPAGTASPTLGPASGLAIINVGAWIAPSTSRTSVEYHTSQKSSAALGDAACRISFAARRMNAGSRERAMQRQKLERRRFG